jgi:hypothetical protein
MDTRIYKIRRYLVGIIFAAALLFLESCLMDQEQPEEDLENRMVTVRIPIAQSSRTALLPLPFDTELNAPATRSTWIDYYEAVFRDHETGTYYTGRASTSVSYLTVEVLAGKTYDVLVLAGTSVSRNAGAVKVLLASGLIRDQPIVYGPNEITVPMTVHTTNGDISDLPFVYTARIQNIKALITAAELTGAALIYRPPSLPSPDPPPAPPDVDNPPDTPDPAPSADPLADYTDGAQAYLENIPTSSEPFNQISVPITLTNIASDSIDVIIEITAEDINSITGARICYYDLTYYGFSDSASESVWSIRRGLTHDLHPIVGGAVKP